jgi:hypothetical protein
MEADGVSGDAVLGFAPLRQRKGDYDFRFAYALAVSHEHQARMPVLPSARREGSEGASARPDSSPRRWRTAIKRAPGVQGSSRFDAFTV